MSCVVVIEWAIMKIKHISVVMEHDGSSEVLKSSVSTYQRKNSKFTKRVEVRVLVGVEVGDGGVCCGESDDWDNY